MWTLRDEAAWQELLEWEQSLAAKQQDTSTFGSLLAMIPVESVEQMLSQAEWLAARALLFLQDERFYEKTKQPVVQTAQLFREDITGIDELAQLTIDQAAYISAQEQKKWRTAARVQGALAGAGGFLSAAGSAAIFPVLELNLIQAVALSYGIDVRAEAEQDRLIRVFFAAQLPDERLADGWVELIAELEEPFSIPGESGVSAESLYGPIQQAAIQLAAGLFKPASKKARLPLLNMAAGAFLNGRRIEKTARLAEQYSRYHYLHRKR